MTRKVIVIIVALVVIVIIGFIVAGVVKPTYQGELSVTVNAPVAKTFSVFNNTDNMGKWMNNFKSISNVSGAKNEVGSKWKMVFDENGRDMVINETVTAFEQDKHFAFDMEDDFALFHVDINFEEKEGKTVITQTSSGTGKGVMARSMIAIMSGGIKMQQLEMYNKLKALVENP